MGIYMYQTKEKNQATVTPSVVVKLFVTVPHEFNNRLEQQ